MIVAMLAAGIEMVMRMKNADIYNRLAKAKNQSEKAAIVQETEKFAFEVADIIFRPDNEIGLDGIQVKEDFIKTIIEHNYRYFNLPTPFEQGATMTEIKFRNGIFVH